MQAKTPLGSQAQESLGGTAGRGPAGHTQALVVLSVCAAGRGGWAGPAPGTVVGRWPLPFLTQDAGTGMCEVCEERYRVCVLTRGRMVCAGEPGLCGSVLGACRGDSQEGVLEKSPSRGPGSHVHLGLSLTQVTQDQLFPGARHIFATVDGAGPAALGQWAPLATAAGPAHPHRRWPRAPHQLRPDEVLELTGASGQQDYPGRFSPAALPLFYPENASAEGDRSCQPQL